MFPTFVSTKTKTVMKLNDILVSSGGYECTDVTFYKVMEVKNGYVNLRVLKNKTVEFTPSNGNLGSGKVIPTETFMHDKVVRRKIINGEYDSYVVIVKNIYESAHLWDGTPQQFDFRNI